MNKPQPRNFIFLIYLLLAVGTAVCFWQVHNFDFITFDDPGYVFENPHVTTGLRMDNIIWAFTTGYGANWHPLTWLSLMLDCQLFGPNPGWIHLENAFLHLLNTLLLFAVLKKITNSLWPSAFVAALFALHPMHVESVAWISERKDVLSTLFLLLTLATYIGYVKRRSLPSYLLTVLLFALGLMAKPMLVTLPFVLLLLDYWPLNRLAAPQPIKPSGRQSRKPAAIHDRHTVLYQLIIEKIPFFVLSVASSVITFFVQRSGGAVVDINYISLQSRVANAFLSYAKYIGKMFWPTNLAVFYPIPEAGLPLWQITLAVAVLLGVTVWVITSARKQKYLFVGWFWFVGTLIPVIGLVQVGVQAMADRYTYIPYIGLFIMVAWSIPELLSRWPYQRIALGISMLIVISVLGICTFRQVSYWKDGNAVFSHALEVTQNNYAAHECLADAFNKQGKVTLAIEHFEKVLQIKPNSAIAKNNLAWILATSPDPNIRDPSEAIRLAQEACIATNYKKASRLDTLGAAYASAGRFAEAIGMAQRALSLVDKNDKYMLEQFQRHLDLYKVSRPYIETWQENKNAK